VGEGRVTTMAALTEIVNFRKITVICLNLFHRNNFKIFEHKKIKILFKIFILLLGMAALLPPPTHPRHPWERSRLYVCKFSFVSIKSQKRYVQPELTNVLFLYLNLPY
jgi:hypothetical protein